jgi:hypothetical protein
MKTTPFISSVKVETKGAHEHVHIWVRGQLVGTLIMSQGDGARMKAALGDPSWLVKDFHVLYHVAEVEAVQAQLDGYDTANRRDLSRQLARLRPALEECDALRETARLLSGGYGEDGG